VSKPTIHKGNPLGDLRAEHDTAMLDAAFYETPDYLSLIESSDRIVVVGRRGTGKSAMAYQLCKYWYGVEKTRVILISFEEEHVIGLCPEIEAFGNKYNIIRAGCRVAWRYCLVLEIALVLSLYYRFEKADENGLLTSHLNTWKKMGGTATARLRKLLQSHLAKDMRPESQIANLAEKLDLSGIEAALGNVLDTLGFNCVVLIDRLDEGYEPNPISVGHVDGIVSATVELNAKYGHVRPAVFLRDNIFRTMARWNPDYSRNIEGQVLRLHWNEYHLFNMVCNRLRVAFKIEKEASLGVWNRCVARELKGKEGFRRCLQLTLYRPRDILVLLNRAFYEAARENRNEIVPSDVEVSAKSISQDRLQDLHKEYSAIFPGLARLTKSFANASAKLTLAKAKEVIGQALSAPTYTVQAEQEFAILSDPLDILRALYGIGFIGVHDPTTGIYLFCHDGHNPDHELQDNDNLLVHPCYWMALNLTQSALGPAEAEEIHDEYDITVTETNLELRKKKLNSIISALGQIGLGEEAQARFEEWCEEAISTVFAGALRNVELRSGPKEQTHRQVAALNLGRTPVWGYFLQQYGARHVTFAIINEEDPGRETFEAATADLPKGAGSLVFLVTRADNVEMRAGEDLDWVRELHGARGVVVIKLTGKFLANMLGKLRNPQKHDAIEDGLRKIVNLYSTYFQIETLKKVEKQASKQPPQPAEPVVIDLPAKHCYGEIDIDEEGRPLLRLFSAREGAGRRPELCSPIMLNDRDYRLLEAGIANARKRFIDERYAEAQGDGRALSRPECEPPEEFTYEVEWTQDDLAAIVHEEEDFGELKKAQKRVIKSAVHRLRRLVRFAPDDLGLVHEADEAYVRRTTIPFRYRKSG